MKKLFCLLAILFAFSTTFAGYGEISAGLGLGNIYPADGSENLTQIWGSYTYFPSSWSFNKIIPIDFGLDASAAYFYSKADVADKNIAVFSLGPEARLFLYEGKTLAPFFEAGASASWQSKTRFDDRELDMHFTFEDLVGLGIRINTKKPITLGVRWYHYSNCGMGEVNRGFSMPTSFYVAIQI